MGNKKNNLIAIAALLYYVLALVSCKAPVKERITRKWQEVRVENRQMDDALYKQQLFMDTVGSNTDTAQNLFLYGIANQDTLKARLQASIDAYRKAQDYGIRSTWFDFRRNGVVYTHSEKHLDSAAWYLDEHQKTLFIDMPKLKGSGRKQSFEVVEASDTLLKLLFTDNNLTGTAVFRPAKG